MSTLPTQESGLSREPVGSQSTASPEFDRYAPGYSALLDDPLRNRFARDPLHFHRRKWFLIRSVLRRFDVAAETQRWLDVGCGQGQLLELASLNFREAAGCDPSAVMLPSHASFAVHQQPSPVELPFEDGSFDFVTAVCVYHHVHGEARTRLANEIKRVLSPGGLCCIIEHNPWNPATQVIVRRCAVDVDAELLSAGKTLRLFEASGFTPLTTEYFLYFPERLFDPLRWIEARLHKVPLGGQYLSLLRAPGTPAFSAAASPLGS
ncbi:MAG TPA: methyltransferase domain-containing protein [Acidobacteriaceae bacterium]|jgi:SAM-dependent methyltransferase